MPTSRARNLSRRRPPPPSQIPAATNRFRCRLSQVLISWPFRRRGSGSGAGGGTSKSAAAEEDEELGVTPQLLDFLRTLSPDAFKAAALQLQGGDAEATAGDLTSWQERHAVLVLSKAKELAKIRYDLCPRHMKDKQFWRIYFLLAKSYISPTEVLPLHELC
ncbi:unnamed protein product [Urochloa humidicola]